MVWVSGKLVELESRVASVVFINVSVVRFWSCAGSYFAHLVEFQLTVSCLQNLVSLLVVGL